MKKKEIEKYCKNCEELERRNFKHLGYCDNPKSPYYLKVVFEHQFCDFHIFKDEILEK